LYELSLKYLPSSFLLAIHDHHHHQEEGRSLCVNRKEHPVVKMMEKSKTGTKEEDSEFDRRLEVKAKDYMKRGRK